jgi:hypothetical protein
MTLEYGILVSSGSCSAMVAHCSLPDSSGLLIYWKRPYYSWPACMLIVWILVSDPASDATLSHFVPLRCPPDLMKCSIFSKVTTCNDILKFLT